MSEKKMVRRSVAITLGIICILLIAIIAYFSITGISAQNSFNNLQNQNNQLQTWLDGNKTLLGQTQTWLNGNQTLLNQIQTWLEGNITAYNSYVSDHHNTDGQYNSEVNQYNTYVADHHQTDGDYSLLTAANLTEVGVSVSNFNHIYVWDPSNHLTINGYIFNMGTNTAYNCKLHIRVWSSTNTLLIDTTIDYGTILGRSYVTISQNTEVPYTGTGSYWDVTPQWTSS